MNLIHASFLLCVKMKREKRKIGRGLGLPGRNPRIQYHALSLAISTSLFIHRTRRWYLVFLWSLQRKGQWSGSRDLSKIFKPFLLLVKPLTQFIVLLWVYCFKIAAPDVFLVQNPPSDLTLAAVKWASCLRHSAFIVAGITLDALCWHYPLEVVNLEQYTDGFHPYPFSLY